MSGETKALGAALDHLDIEREATLALHDLASLVAGNNAAQFIHQYARIQGKRDTVEHVREGCRFCDLLQTVERGLRAYRSLARHEAAAAPAPSPTDGPA